MMSSGFGHGVVTGARAPWWRWSFRAPSGRSGWRASAARNCCATRIGADRSRYRPRRRSPGSAVTRPTSASRARCLATACRVIGRRAARSVAVAGPVAASAARMARLLGSARAAKTCSATASMSGGIEVVGQFAQFVRPAPGIAVVGLAVNVIGQLGEPAFDNGQPGARAGRFERELDVGPTRILLGQPIDVPGERAHRRLPHAFHPQVGRGPVGPPHPGRPARAQVDRRLVAEPGAQALRRGERRPDLARRVSELHCPRDPIRKTHDGLRLVATERLLYYSNQLVASTAPLAGGAGRVSEASICPAQPGTGGTREPAPSPRRVTMDDNPALPWLARPGARSWTCGVSAPVRDGAVRAYHASLPGYAPTPLAEVPALAAELGAGRGFVKDESARLGLPAFKVLGASWGVPRGGCAGPARGRGGGWPPPGRPPRRGGPGSGRGRPAGGAWGWSPPPTATTAGGWPGWRGCPVCPRGCSCPP